MSMHGVSVSVTSLTDVLCYLIGMSSNLRMCVLFRYGFMMFLDKSIFTSTYTAVALTIDFIYQMTFYVAFIAVINRKSDFSKIAARATHLKFITFTSETIAQKSVAEIRAPSNIILLHEQIRVHGSCLVTYGNRFSKRLLDYWYSC
jgi:hypothetical protein